MPGLRKYTRRSNVTARKLPFYRNMNIPKTHGYNFKPPRNAPTVNENPFRKKLLKIVKPSDAIPPVPGLAYIRMSDIVQAIVDSNKIVLEGESMAVRLQKIMAYCHPTPTVPRPVVTLKSIGLIPSANDTTTLAGNVNPIKYSYCNEVKDTGNLSTTASVGWMWSAAERAYTMTATEDSSENFIVAEVKTSTESTEIYVLVEFCTGLGEVPPVDSV